MRLFWDFFRLESRETAFILFYFSLLYVSLYYVILFYSVKTVKILKAHRWVEVGKVALGVAALKTRWG